MKQIAVFLAEGFEEIEGLTVTDLFAQGRRYCDERIGHRRKDSTWLTRNRCRGRRPV